jgi:hypothetical protein
MTSAVRSNAITRRPAVSHSSNSEPTAATALGLRSRPRLYECFRKSLRSWRDGKRLFSAPNRRS